MGEKELVFSIDETSKCHPLWGRSTVLIKYIHIRFQIKKRLYEDL